MVRKSVSEEVASTGQPADVGGLSPDQVDLLFELTGHILDGEPQGVVLLGFLDRLRTQLNIHAEFGFVARMNGSLAISGSTGELPLECLEPLRHFATTRQEIHLCDVQSTTDPNFEHVRMRGYYAFASVPIEIGCDLHGVVCFGIDHCTQFSATELTFFKAVARGVAMAIDRRETGLEFQDWDRELQHRVNNMLSMVQALAMLSRKGSPDIEVFHRNFDERLVSLARTHNLVTSPARGIDLRDLLEAELAPFHLGNRVTLSGPPVDLPIADAMLVGLAMHELVANAAKHGALSAEDGMLSILWSAHVRPGERRILLHWLEEGGETIEERGRREFGADLLDQSLGTNFQVDREFLDAGVRATIALTLEG